MATLTVLPRSRAVSCILAGLALGATASGQVFPGEHIDIGNYPFDVDAADFDSDGHLDLAVAVRGVPGHVSMVLADGTGGFLGPVDYSAYDAVSLAVADYDGDGHLDVAVATDDPATSPGTTLTVYLGSANGTLFHAATIPIDFDADDLEAGDFDRDGRPDLASSSWQDGVVEVGLNLGGSTFGAFASVGVFTEPRDLSVVDLDGDGALDLVVPDVPSQVRVLRGTGTGGFLVAPAIPACGGVIAAVVADLVPGGGLDLACACAPGFSSDVPATTSVEIRSGDGMGGFALFDSELVTAYPTEISAGDIDGDGRADLAVTTLVDYAVLRNGSAGLSSPEHWAGIYGGSGDRPHDVELVDVDADGRLDLVGVDDHLRVLRGLGGGDLEGARVWKYAPPLGIPLSTALQPAIGIAAADLDGNGAPDLVVPGQDGVVTVLPTDGSGSILAPSSQPAPPRIVAAHVGQVDGDGSPDVFFAASDPPSLHMALGNGAGGFGPPSSLALTLAPKDSTVGDFDGDGDADIAAAVGNAVQVVHASGAGFSGSPLVLALTPEPVDIAAGDLDLDGDLDLAAMGWKLVTGAFGWQFTDPTYRVFLADPSGGFTALPKVEGFDLAPSDLGLSDVDADGKLDMLALGTYAGGLPGYGGARLRRYLGTGLGTFSAKLDVEPVQGGTSHLWLGDLNGDGTPDVVAGGSQLVELFRSNGSGGFSAPTVHVTGAGGQAGTLVDLDADGWLDLARATANNSTWWWQPGVSVLRNAGADATGAAAFGGGTPGCAGVLAIGANASPAIGSPTFAIVGTGVAPGALGWGFFASAADPTGSDPLSLGLLFHLDLLSGGPLVPFAIASGPSGATIAKLPIPLAPELVNAVVYAQEFWLPPPWQSCGGAPFGLVSSRGLRLTVQP